MKNFSINELKAAVKRLIGRILASRMRRRGVKVGQRLAMRQLPLLRVCRGSSIAIGDDCTIHNKTWQNIAGILHKTIIATTDPRAKISIGNKVGISGAIIVASTSIRIEDEVMLGANVKIYDSDFHPLDFHARMGDDAVEVGRGSVVVRRGAWVGADAILLKGAQIGEYAVVGARSVVTGPVERCCVFAGNPAKFVKRLPEPRATVV